eukprot:SAG31_NODE_6499_length_1994_cov_2.311346_1_plen_450_part_10
MARMLLETDAWRAARGLSAGRQYMYEYSRPGVPSLMDHLRLSGSWESLAPPPGCPNPDWKSPRALTVDKRGYVYWADGATIFQCVDGVGERRPRESHVEADEAAKPDQQVVVFHRGEAELLALCTTPGGWICACEQQDTRTRRLMLYSRAIPRAAEFAGEAEGVRMLAEGVGGVACTCSRAGRVYVADPSGANCSDKCSNTCSLWLVDAGPEMRARPPRILPLALPVSTTAVALALSPDQHQLFVATIEGQLHVFWLAPDGSLADPVARPTNLPPGATSCSTFSRQTVQGNIDSSGSTSVTGQLLLATTNGAFGRSSSGGWAALDLNGTPAVTVAHSAALRDLAGPSSVAVGSGSTGAVWPAIESFVSYDSQNCMLYLTCGNGGGVWRRRCTGLGAIIASENPVGSIVRPKKQRQSTNETDDDKEYEVERILDHRWDNRNKTWEYLIQWK